MRPLNSINGVSLRVFSKVMISHCQALKLASFSDVYTANNILNGYVRSGVLFAADKLFDEMFHRDLVSWNTMIAGNVKCANLETAWEVLKTMKRRGFEFDEYTFGSILKGVACADRLDVGQQLHCMISKMGYAENVYSGSALLDMYAKCETLENAHMVFLDMPNANTVSWNALIAGYAQFNDLRMAFWLFNSMEKDNVEVDEGSFAPLLPLLDEVKFYNLTMEMHGKIVKHGLSSYKTLCNALLTAYSECGSLDSAQRVFDSSAGVRDLVTWNSMLSAYLVHDMEDLGFKCLIDMEGDGFQPDIYSYTSIISARFGEERSDQGKVLHGVIVKRGLEESVPISNALIAMYLKSSSKSMVEALNIFESLELKDRVSWNSILTGFSQAGLSEDAVKFFMHLRYEIEDIDHYAFSAVLRSCSDLAAFQLGQQVHGLAIKFSFDFNDFVASSLIFMYSKCGVIEDARKSFEITSKETSITWNSIIFGYAQHGLGDLALNLFFQMRDRNVKLDHITFVAVLNACSHIGLVEQGSNLLRCMESRYGIRPRMEHYACAVDLYGRAGHLEEAKALIEDMPFEPDTMVWKTFLGACRSCGNIELATQVAGNLLELEPQEHCTYVLLSNMYGHLLRWDEKANVKRLMRERGVKKVPGWSWIEVMNRIHSFNAEDRSHPQFGQMHVLLDGLMEEIKGFDMHSILEDDLNHLEP